MGFGFDIIAARGKDISDWMDILVPLVFALIYGINWLISRVIESGKKDRSDPAVSAEKEQPLPVRRQITSPLKRAVPIKKQPTLSEELGRLAGQVINQVNPQLPKLAESPNQTPLPQRRVPIRSQPAPRSRPQRIAAPEIPQQPYPSVRSQPQTLPPIPSPRQSSPRIQQSVPTVTRSRPTSVPAASDRSAVSKPRTPTPASVQPPKPEPASAPTSPLFLGNLLGNRDHLYEAIVFSEVLGRPLALRSDSFDPY